MKKKNLLSKAEMKHIIGGNNNQACLTIGSVCNSNFQCCIGMCVLFPNKTYRVCSGPESV